MRWIRRLLEVLRGSPRPGTSVGRLIGIGAGSTVLAALAIYGVVLYPLLEVTNTTEFCASCHSMEETVYREYKTSLHYANASGVRAGCPDCHVPKPLGEKLVAKVLAAKDVWHEILGTIDTPEKFEAHRWRMANVVWAKFERSDSANCRTCHSWESMDLGEQDRMARSKHRSAREEGRTCIECHKGLVHRLPRAPEPASAELTPDADMGPVSRDAGNAAGGVRPTRQDS